MFNPAVPFKHGLMSASKASAHLSKAPLRPSNIRLDWKGFAGTNTLAENFSLHKGQQDETWAEISTLEVAICIQGIYVGIQA